MSAGPSWHLDCSGVGGARDTGDGNITSCSRLSVTVVRTVTGHKAMRSSHAASPIFLSSRRSLSSACLLDTPGAAPYVQTFRTSEGSMLDQYRRDYAEFNAAVMREHYLFGSGQK